MAESLHDSEGTQANGIGEDSPSGASGNGQIVDGQSEAAGSQNPASNSEVAVSVETEGLPSPTARLEPSGEAIEQELESLSRAPFRRILKDFLGFTPTPEALKRFADKYPDKWAKSIGVIAQLAGYQSDVVETNNILIIGHMNDSDLRKRMAELEQKLNVSHNVITSKIESAPSRRLHEANPSSDTIIDVEATLRKEQ